MGETWREISGYEGLYEVSDLGRVRSLDRTCGHRWGGVAVKRGMIRAQPLDKDGYPHVVLSREGRLSTKKVHRLVAQHFVANPEGHTEINHRDSNKANARADNLEWCSRRENQVHAASNGAFGGTTNPKRAKKLTAASVAEMRGGFASGESLEQLAARFGVSKATASRVVRSLIWV